MSLAEIQKAIEALAPEEQEELRNWLDGYEPAMEREWAALAQERMRQIITIIKNSKNAADGADGN
jgi:hypothetical protein